MGKKLNISKVVLVMSIFAFGLRGNAQEKIISENELPQTAKDFITKNFSEQKVVQTVKDIDYWIKTEYEVTLDNAFYLEFDGSGNWKEIDGKDTAIPTEFIPEPIIQYVSENFPTQKSTKIEKKSSGYELELSNGLDLDFNAKGKFIGIDD